MNLLPKRKRKPRIFDMTPMIDVVFQLLIFFLFTSRFTETARTPMDLPDQPGDGAIDQPADIVVDVLPDGMLLVNGASADLGAFEATLETSILKFGDPALVEVLVRADEAAMAAQVNRVVGVMARLDVRLWRLGTAVPGGEER